MRASGLFGAGWPFVASAALSASVLGHQLVAFAEPEGEYHAYAHVAVGPATVAALLLAVIGLSIALAARRRCLPFGRRSPLIAAAVGLGRSSVAMQIGVTFAGQCAALFLMENVEHLCADGSPSAALDWLGASPGLALMVHLALAIAVTLAVRWWLGGMVAACDDVLRALEALVRAARRLIIRRDLVASVRLDPIVPCVASPLARRSGLRAPPFA